MPPQEDYILRQLALLRQWVSRIMRLRKGGQPAAALRESIQAQEALFASPFSEYAATTLENQWVLLGRGESVEGARERRFAHAVLLLETGYIYRDLHRDDLSAGCMALSAEVMSRLEREGPLTAEMNALLAELRTPGGEISTNGKAE